MRARSIIVYSVLRLLAFLVPLGIMMLIPIFHELYWFAIGFAAIIGISLSMIFLSGPRDEVAKELAARRKTRTRTRTTVDDEDRVVEDAANDMVRGVPVDDEAAADIADAGGMSAAARRATDAASGDPAAGEQPHPGR